MREKETESIWTCDRNIPGTCTGETSGVRKAGTAAVARWGRCASGCSGRLRSNGEIVLEAKSGEIVLKAKNGEIILGAKSGEIVLEAEKK